MRDDGAVACHKFRNRVTECGALAHRDIVLNYGGLALFLSHNQVARMAHERRVRRSRNEQQENRIFDDCALADMYVRSVLGKGGVQRTESITTSIEITAKCASIAPGLLSISSAKPLTFTPAGILPTDESSRTKCPLTNTSWHAAPLIRNCSSSSFANWPFCANSKEVRAMAETLVNRQSSSWVVGKPTSQKRAKASSRSRRSHGRLRPAARFWNSVKLSRQVSN